MHATQAYAAPHRFLAAAPPRSGMIAYLRGFTITVWLLSMLIRLWWIRDWWSLQEMAQAGINVKEHFYIGFAVALLGHLTLGPQAWISAPFILLSDWTGRLITAFLLLMLLLAPLSLIPRTSALYAIGTWGVVVLLLLFWSSNYFVLQRVLVFTGIVLLGWLFVLLVKHGLTGGFAGQIGGINRNVTSTAAVAAMIMMLFSSNRILRWAAIGCACFLVVAVTSRGSILATGTFLAIYYGIYKGTFKATAYAVGGVLFASLVLSAFPGLREMIFEDVMKLSDKSRGLGSGFTGRFDMWVQALAEFWKRPVFGYGFRTSSMQIGSDFGGIHSAYIKILLEGGFVGAILVIATAVVELIRRLRLATRLRTMGSNEMPGMDLKESFRVNAICCASLCLLLTLWVYDQYYINLGSPISIIFFLVITAPTFITSQGITTRRPEHIARRIALTGRPA